MVALSYRDDDGTGALDIGAFVRARVAQVSNGTLPPWVQFPLDNLGTDTVRSIFGLQGNVVVAWLDPLSSSDTASAPRFGSNADYIAYFGDGWDAVAGDAPQWNGDGTAGWVWVNHEYVSGNRPRTTAAADSGQLTLAHWLYDRGVIQTEPTASAWPQASIDTYLEHAKKQLGGSWFRIVQDPGSGDWVVDLSADPVRYDATSNTLLRLTGQTLAAADHEDDGTPLSTGIVAGIAGDCSGGQTPWGTIITAEENIQDYYGDLESCWDSNQKFLTGQGFDPGANITPNFNPSTSAEFGSHSNVNQRHNRDVYGYLAEIDPGQPADEYEGRTAPGVGHKKVGYLGRARWENAAFATDQDWKLVPGQPIVMYAGDDRRGGRIYKFVSSGVYTSGMSRAAIRALMDSGSLYAAHFAGLDNTTGTTLLATGVPPSPGSPGTGQWIRLSTTSTDVAPNAAALGVPGTTVGEALLDVDYNGIGGFPDDNTVRQALFTVSNKIGIMELNRPEDIEWNPLDPSGTPRLYVAFTNHNRRMALDQNGVVFPPAMHSTLSPVRADTVGSIFVMEEANPAAPGSSTTFSYWMVWGGSSGVGEYDASCPDNIAIDAAGGVWFGTDGNFGVNDGRADALYYLDLDPAHATTPVVTYGLAFRVAASPSDSEATGPAFSPDMRTLFFNVQHPGEAVGTFSSWPWW
jgi:secreted PhoX family phosphatase